MNRLILTAAICFAGCGLIVQPGPAAKQEESTQSVVFERLAVALENGEFCDSTHRFIKVAGRMLKQAELKAPAGYDDALMPWLDNHPPSDQESKDMAARMRAFK
jgi:hypothetical protein